MKNAFKDPGPLPPKNVLKQKRRQNLKATPPLQPQPSPLPAKIKNHLKKNNQK